MPNVYVKATALPNIVGRCDYVTSPHRQEHLLAAYDGAADLLDGQYWQQLATESRAAFEQFGYETRAGRKEKLKCCEGRELIIQLSNALLDRMEPTEIVKTLADEFENKLGLTVCIGLHLRSKESKKDNLHAHVVFPERQLLEEPVIKVAERNLFFDADGKRRYKKSEILDENKQLLPGCRIVQKGEVYECRYFGSVDTKYSSKDWLQDVKTNVILPLRNGKLKGDVEITEFNRGSDLLPQIPVGVIKDIDGDEARAKAARIKKYNQELQLCRELVKQEGIPQHVKDMVRHRVSSARGQERNNVLLLFVKRIVDTLLNVLGIKDRYEGQHVSIEDLGRIIKLVNELIKAKATPAEMAVIAEQQPSRAFKDWNIQASLDALRIAREEGSADLNAVLKKRGREIGEAQRALNKAIQTRDPDAIEAASEQVKDARKKYKETARAAATTQLTDKPFEVDRADLIDSR